MARLLHPHFNTRLTAPSIPSISSVTTAPLPSIAQSQGAHVGSLHVQDSSDGASRLALPIASFPGSRVAELRRQHLNGNNSVSHTTVSQPNPGWTVSITHGNARPSSQPAVHGVILNSPRRTRSQGLNSAYRLSYVSQGFEQSYFPIK